MKVWIMFAFAHHVFPLFSWVPGTSVEKEMATHSGILAWETHGQRSLVGYSPWGRKELDTTERLNNNNNNSWHIVCVLLKNC